MSKAFAVFPTSEETFEQPVNVNFPGKPPKTISFTAEFRRISQSDLEETMADCTLSELVEKITVSVSGIGRTADEELPADEQLQIVLDCPEACMAVRDAFFTARQQKGSGKTSNKRRRFG